MSSFEKEIHHPLVKVVRPWLRRYHSSLNNIKDLMKIEDQVYREYCLKYETFPLLRGLITEFFLEYVLNVYGHNKSLGSLKRIIPIYEWDAELDFCGIDYIGITCEDKFIVINGKRGGGLNVPQLWSWNKKDRNGKVAENISPLLASGVACFGQELKEAYIITLASENNIDDNLKKMINQPHQMCRIVGYETLKELINFDDEAVCKELIEGFKWSIENSVPCDEYVSIELRPYQKEASIEQKKEADKKVASLLISSTGSGKTIIAKTLLEKEF